MGEDDKNILWRYLEELLNTSKSIDTTLKRIEQRYFGNKPMPSKYKENSSDT